MTYRAGMAPGMARFGYEEGPPYIRCDVCGTRLLAQTKAGRAPEWLLAGKAPPGWRMIRLQWPDLLRLDYCPAHHAEFEAERIRRG